MKKILLAFCFICCNCFAFYYTDAKGIHYAESLYNKTLYNVSEGFVYDISGKKVNLSNRIGLKLLSPGEKYEDKELKTGEYKRYVYLKNLSEIDFKNNRDKRIYKIKTTVYLRKDGESKNISVRNGFLIHADDYVIVKSNDYVKKQIFFKTRCKIPSRYKCKVEIGKIASFDNSNKHRLTMDFTYNDSKYKDDYSLKSIPSYIDVNSVIGKKITDLLLKNIHEFVCEVVIVYTGEDINDLVEIF